MRALVASFALLCSAFTAPAVSEDYLRDVVMISAGGQSTCALTSSGSVYCWGYAATNTPGVGVDLLYPARVPNLTPVSGISTGFAHSCAVNSTGAAFCWGSNSLGQLGNGSLSNSANPVSVVGLNAGVDQISAGGYHTCARSSGTLRCWGRNDNGAVGDGTTTNRSAPVVLALAGVRSVTTAGGTTQAGIPGASSDHTCAETTTDATYCWGNNRSDVFGDGGAVFPYTAFPSLVSSSGWSSVVTGESLTCMTIGGGLRCTGQWHIGGGGLSSTPVPIANVPTSLMVAAGQSHACATDSFGVRCWGSNLFGSLGNSTNSDSTSGVQASGLTFAVGGLAAGDHHSCALLPDGRVSCWGRNARGQLGNGSQVDSNAPALVRAPDVIFAGGFEL